MTEALTRISDVYAEVGRVPPTSTRGSRPSITDRMHALEAASAPVAIDAAVERMLDRRRATFWKRWQKVVTVLGASAAGVIAVVEAAVKIYNLTH